MEKLKIAMAFMALIAIAGCSDEPSNPAPQSKPATSVSNVPPPPPPPPPSTSSSTNPTIPSSPTDAGNTNATTANVPSWQPDPAMLDKLEPYQDFEGYQIRVPKGYKIVSGMTPPPGAKATAWAGESREDGTRPMIMIMLMTPPPNAAKHTLPEVLEAMLGKIKQSRNNWQQSAVEEGQVNNLKFLKTSWQGQDKQTQFNMQGFEYVTQDDSSFIEIRTQDMEQYPDALKIGNASILTFRKK